ncbi:MAG: DNA polymerase III subunit alpha, partial [Candidatus Staskawiczbacteria bacterium]|nr:DNA polymerase III subunit alpha [Candidatus Staskawiczbacteria bacterium]
LLANRLEEAEETARKYEKWLGKGNFYLELQYHANIPDQEIANKRLIELSKKTGVPLVCTNDIHYLRKEDSEAQDVLMLINTGADVNDSERLSMLKEDFSMKSPEQMEEEFKDFPEAFENAKKIADMCNITIELGKTKLPTFPLPEGKTAEEYLEEICWEGAKTRYGENPDKAVTDRLKYELSVIEKTGFAGYFLIVEDFVNWAKKNRIIVGPGRGSAGGSIVAYLSGITNVDPLKHDLLFERFLNPERISMPDIDMDFADRRRDEVIKYVAEKYGADHVAQIITFGTMAARAVIRDVGRALQYTYSYCDTMAKMVPLGMDLTETLEKVDEFKNMYEIDPMAKKLIDLGKKLEGVARHASTHACGVVISAAPLTDSVPLQRPKESETGVITQFEGHSIEDLGLLKMDFLGLKNLTIIEDTLARIYVLNNNLKIDLDKIPENDEKTFKLLQDALTTSVFQLESDGMKRYLKELHPTTFEDITAMVALYRPGPMQFIPDYISRKHSGERITYIHPKLEPILKGTYGICIYQEQLMKIAQEVCGFTLG